MFTSILTGLQNGKLKDAFDCGRLALHYAQYNEKETIYISLANILMRAGQYEGMYVCMSIHQLTQPRPDAIKVATWAVNINPTQAISYLTLANALSAGNMVHQAALFYEMTLRQRPHTLIAMHSLKRVMCEALIREKNRLVGSLCLLTHLPTCFAA